MTRDELEAALAALVPADEAGGAIAVLEQMVARLDGLTGAERVAAERAVLRSVALRVARLTMVVESFARKAPHIDGLPEAGRAMAAFSLALARPAEHKSTLGHVAREMTKAAPELKARLAEAGQPMLGTDHEEAWFLADAYDRATKDAQEAAILESVGAGRSVAEDAWFEMLLALRACSRYRSLALMAEVCGPADGLIERIRTEIVCGDLKSAETRRKVVRMFLRSMGVPEAVAKEALKRER